MEGQQFDQLKALVTAVNTAVINVAGQVDAQSKESAKNQQSFADLGRQLDTMNTQLAALSQQIATITNRVDTIEQSEEQLTSLETQQTNTNV